VTGPSVSLVVGEKLSHELDPSN